VKNTKTPNSRFTDRMQWVLPTKGAKKKDVFAYKTSRSWKERSHKWKPLHNPPLSPHDSAIFFLHIASEVEHALMVQYLYAAFSLGGKQVPEDKKELVNEWRVKILGIAREEMGHLITVQNILHAIGGPLTFQREDFPFDSQLYPFHFALEPLTLQSLAKYVVAEMPSEEFLRKHRKDLLKEIQPIKRLAAKGNKSDNINRVGMIYEKVQQLLDAVDPSDFLADSLSFQSPHSAWGTNDTNIVIETANDVKAAKEALAKVAEQGEGEEIGESKTHRHPSHFERFMEVYRAFPKTDKWKPAKNVPVNPSTNVSADKPGVSDITHEVSLLWAQLSNQRYRMILLYLSHSLQMDISPASFYGHLVSWSFGEMYNLRSISDILTTLPQRNNGPKDHYAASPFELPYNLNLPSREVNKWRAHRDQIQNSRIIINELLEYKNKAHEIYLHALKNSDEQALIIINSVINA
jgi:rubrerythrin